jgi:hypothetical protein
MLIIFLQITNVAIINMNVPEIERTTIIIITDVDDSYY